MYKLYFIAWIKIKKSNVHSLTWSSLLFIYVWRVNFVFQCRNLLLLQGSGKMDDHYRSKDTPNARIFHPTSYEWHLNSDSQLESGMHFRMKLMIINWSKTPKKLKYCFFVSPNLPPIWHPKCLHLPHLSRITPPNTIFIYAL